VPVQAQGVSVWRALTIPGVLPFAATLFFCKLVAYTFLYWLPYYLSSSPIGGRHLSPKARCAGSIESSTP
jgi:OPA family glycerol-3-phosphate transporter-like MFS transporter 1/2